MSDVISARRIAAALELPPPTPEQVAVIEHPLTSMLVVAGAGSSKTETMASRVVWLVANHLVRPEDVLGLTFTRKASGELAERIARRLRHLARSGLWAPEATDEPSSAGSTALCGAEVGQAIEDAPGAAPAGESSSGEAWARETGPPGGDALVLAPTVSTYHAYAGRLVRDHGLLLGVESDSRLLTEAGAWQLAHEAVVTYDEPVPGLDAAESTVTAAVLALSAELAEHLRDIDDVEAVLAQLTEQIGSKPLGGRRRGIPAQVAALLAHARQQRAILPLVRRYAQLKRRRDCVDFADQMALAARLAMTCPEVALSERSRHRLVLLDEFQDTSEAQMSFLHALFAATEPLVGPGDTVATSRGAAVPVMAVGDPHQSIYGWRGASATTLGGFARRFGGAGSTPAVQWVETSTELSTEPLAEPPTEPPEGRETEDRAAQPTGQSGRPPGRVPTLQLSTSWRNDEAVLEVANAVAEPLSRASTVPVARLVPAPAAARGRVGVLRAETMRTEAEGVAAWIAQRWRASRSDPGARGVSAAVLCRRRAQFPALVEALRAEGLPVEVVGVGGLLLTPEVADLHALLAVAGDPARGDMLMRLLTGPAVRLGAADLDGLAAWARHLHRAALTAPAGQRTPTGAPTPDKGAASTDSEAGEADGPAVSSPGADAGVSGGTAGMALGGMTEVHDLPSIVEAVSALPPPAWQTAAGERVSPTGRRRLADLAEAIAQGRRSLGAPLVDVVRIAEEALGLDVEVLARPEVPWAAARVHLDAFLDVAAHFEAAADRPTLEGFLAWLEAAKEQERGLETPAAHTNEDAVQVLTVHAAKGLEWDVVAVPGLVDASFPSFRCGPTLARNGAWASAQPKDRGWTTGLDRIPYGLRGDVAGLPPLSWSDAPDLDDLEHRLEDFSQAGGEHAIAEERRLAYVALTRARHDLLLAGSVWTEAASPRITSRFLTEILEGAPEVDILDWAPMPPADGTPVLNPATAQGTTALWPAPDPHVLAEPDTPGLSPEPDEPLDLATLETEIDVLLAARERSAAGRDTQQPAHLSASELVRFAADPAQFLLQLRRPVPQRPSKAARSGTLLHGWIEEHFARASIVDLDDLPGFVDAGDEADEDGAILQARKERFLASPWASRTPRALELPVETVVDGISLRGRLDAVFDEPDGRVVIVDWKNARPPTGRALAARSLQLSVYRLAYARLTGRPLEEVDAVFYFAETGETVRPAQGRAAEEEIRAQLEALHGELEAATRAGVTGPTRRTSARTATSQSPSRASDQEEGRAPGAREARAARATARSEADSTPGEGSAGAESGASWAATGPEGLPAAPSEASGVPGAPADASGSVGPPTDPRGAGDAPAGSEDSRPEYSRPDPGPRRSARSSGSVTGRASASPADAPGAADGPGSTDSSGSTDGSGAGVAPAVEDEGGAP